ncbi:hypothetical protein TNCV_4718811 [Trichonephila clavipes]|nr:hypothetical protein TNCV_4718811 [Trichonephila clavipes]
MANQPFQVTARETGPSVPHEPELRIFCVLRFEAASEDCTPSHSELPILGKRRWSSDSSENNSWNSISPLKSIKNSRLYHPTEAEDTISSFLVLCTSRKTTSGKKKRCVNKRKKLSDSNPDDINSGTFVRNDRLGWESITSGSCRRGRIAEHSVFKEKNGPTSYAKRNIENSYAISSGRLLIDEPMLHHIKNCTEEKAHWQLG